MENDLDRKVETFIRESGVEALVNEFKASKMNDPIYVSDVYDEDQLQYVDLVQEGGGVWGIALLGYTYAMESMGIRFFSLAGTSAGAINTMLLAAVGNVEDAKSKSILAHFLKEDISAFVDGRGKGTKYTRFVKWMIRTLIKRPVFFRNFLSFLRWGAILFLALSIIVPVGLFFTLWKPLQGLGIMSLVLLAGFAVLYFMLKQRWKVFKRNGYGLNQGDEFLRWLSGSISQHHVYGEESRPVINSLCDFNEHFRKDHAFRLRCGDDFLFRNGSEEAPSSAIRKISIITCDITSQNRIEFPAMWDLYWDDERRVHPGQLVRASMSIPGFFEMYKVKVASPEKKKGIWSEKINWKGADVPSSVYFIDGGAISNFPMDVFSHPEFPIPRRPTLGIRLDSGPDKSRPSKADSARAYASTMLSTIRGYFDKSFFYANPAFLLGISHVDLSGFNSVDFFLDMKSKQQLFRYGAEAALKFLEEFNFNTYKSERNKDNQNRMDRANGII
jgi:NTE family protein